MLEVGGGARRGAKRRRVEQAPRRAARRKIAAERGDAHLSRCKFAPPDITRDARTRGYRGRPGYPETVLRLATLAFVVCLAGVGGAAEGWAAEGDPDVLRIVFPEGWSARQIGDRVAEVRRIAIDRRHITPQLSGSSYVRTTDAKPPRAFRKGAKNRVEGSSSPRCTTSSHTPAQRR